MRRSIEDTIAVLERVEEAIFHAKLAAPSDVVAFHLQPAYQALANVHGEAQAGELTDERAAEIERAAQKLDGIRSPANLHDEALGWSRDLRSLL